MILGLDISTSITGYTLLDSYGNVALCDHIDLTKVEGYLNKARLCQTNLTKLFAQYPINEAWIEESLQMFAMGKSSAKTLATLTKFNGILSWIIYNDFLKTPHYISAVSARKVCCIKTEKGKKGKECVMEYMQANENWFKCEYTKTGKIKPHCYDRADSFIIAKAGFLLTS